MAMAVAIVMALAVAIVMAMAMVMAMVVLSFGYGCRYRHGYGYGCRYRYGYGYGFCYGYGYGCRCRYGYCYRYRYRYAFPGFGAMPSQDSGRVETAKWVHRQLLKLDWPNRHQQMLNLKVKKPAIHELVCKLLSPDECLEGQATGVAVGVGTVIVLRDRPRYRQVTLHRYCRPKLPRKLQEP